MTWRIEIRSRAQADIRNARKWYNREEKGLGDEFALSIENAIEKLRSNPYICQLYYRRFRQLLPQRFPYRIFYTVDTKGVVISRVLHSAQDFTRHLK